jgi:hypothetical protein
MASAAGTGGGVEPSKLESPVDDRASPKEVPMARRLVLSLLASIGVVLIGSTAAFACGGLVAPGHAEVLRRATTLAAWHDGYEHYVTGFQFVGSASSFGYIIPLPGEPSKIQKGGEWTLERLQIEIAPRDEALGQALAVPSPAARSVTVLQQVRIDALDITVVKGGGRDVAQWAEENGFDLTPDTPDVLGRYSDAGAVFALAKFNNKAAAERGVVEGQGTVIHFTIPTDAPWVPLRILALGKGTHEAVDADLFLLTDSRPLLAPNVAAMPGWTVRADAEASKGMLADLRSDKGMGWIPASGMWFTALTLGTEAWTMNYDLSIDGGGPSVVVGSASETPTVVWPLWLAAAGLAAIVVGSTRRSRSGSGLRPA